MRYKLNKIKEYIFDNKKKVLLISLLSIIFMIGFIYILYRARIIHIKPKLDNIYDIPDISTYLKEINNDDYIINDNLDFINKYNLTNIDKSYDNEYMNYIKDLRMNKRINSLDIKLEDSLFAERNWKELYKNSLINKKEFDEVIFNGNNISELNKFIKENINKKIIINSKQLYVDELLSLESNIYLFGNETEIIFNEDYKEFCFGYIDNLNDIYISNFIFDKGINIFYIKNSKNIIIEDNIIRNSYDRSIILSGSYNINILNNKFIHNISSIYIMGNNYNSIIKENIIEESYGTANAFAGIVIDSSNYIDEEISDEFKAVDERLRGPHDILFIGNYIGKGRGNGIYCCGGYNCYFIKNVLILNDKEGICLDFGSIANYLYDNDILNNGYRRDQMDSDLQMDFVYDLGRLEDGSSPAKLPGISMDNAMWNIIHHNNISYNAGSGIKSVRSSIENIIYDNNIIDNNIGSNNIFHFFGIELGAANRLKEANQLKNIMDVVSNYGNIIIQNNIEGKHYSGILLAKESYLNDILNNNISGSIKYDIECLSKKDNNISNN